MSLNFVDSLMDKLFYPKKFNDYPMAKQFMGSQNLMGTNSVMNQNMLSEFHQFLESECLQPNFSAMNQLSSGGKNGFHSFQSSNCSLVNHVPKLFSPSFSNVQDSFSILSSQTDLFFGSEINLSRSSSFLFEALYPRNILFHTNDFRSDEVPTKMPPNPTTFITAVEKSKSDMEKDCSPYLLNEDTELQSRKSKPNGCQTLNQELINRKTKELQKRSKKRRRRQKKNKPTDFKKETTASKNSTIQNGNSEKDKLSVENASQRTASEIKKISRDTLCDIVTSISGEANGVQILLPNMSSFIISIENTGDDDDWDTSSDSEWLSSCTEFELAGLFVPNLSATRITNCFTQGLVSQLDVPATYFDDSEVQEYESVLRKVNRKWNESTKELDKKPKLAAKVTFAQDDKLVKILPVEIYERKGEWETYARERCRFKKRINELEKVLSPCLSKNHREKIFLKLQQTEL